MGLSPLFPPVPTKINFMPFRQYKKYILIAIPILLIGLLIYYFKGIFSYIILGWVLSLLGAPLFRLFNRFLNSTLSSIFSLLSITILFSIGIWLVIPPIVQQTRNLANIDYESIMKNLEEPLQDWNDWLVNRGFLEGQNSTESAQDEGNTLQNSTYDIVKVDTVHGSNITIFIDLERHDETPSENGRSSLFNGSDSFMDPMAKKLFTFFNPNLIPSLFSSVAGFFGNLLITILSALFIAFFFLKEKGLFTRIIQAVLPNDTEDQATHAIEESENLLVRYFVGIAIQVSIITAFMSIALRLFGFENALLIAFMAGLMNLIPYLGPILGAAFGIIITISSNIDVSFYSVLLPSILKLIALFAVMQLMDNFLLQPNIFSKSVKAHPLEIFIIVLIGAKLGGVLGMILAIPMYTVIRVIAKVFLSEFKIVQSITRGL